MSFLTKEAILASDDLKNVDLEVPEWGGTVRIKTMTGTERDAFEASIYDMKGKNKGNKVDMKNFRAKLLVKTMVDEAGKLIFGEDDIEALGKKSSKALDRVFAKAQEVNGIGAKETEELTGNSEASQ